MIHGEGDWMVLVEKFSVIPYFQGSFNIPIENPIFQVLSLYLFRYWDDSSYS